LRRGTDTHPFQDVFEDRYVVRQSRIDACRDAFAIGIYGEVCVVGCGSERDDLSLIGQSNRPPFAQARLGRFTLRSSIILRS
jgi:hypothetical protein